ncbi:MAG: N-formylglutamate amidohydrolase [Gammaproteobacteria bacterium]|nr:N-formylglutamate amidohydrolase [Gammaproteobacteria bacterium]
MQRKPYEIRAAVAPELPVLASIPHAGTYVPESIAAEFATDHIRSLPMTDWHLHQLYDFLPALGVTTLYATYSRFVADLNRPPDDKPLYPGRFETGGVALKTFWGEEIYRIPPSREEINRRRELVHAPYHRQLLELIRAKIAKFGRLVLLDLHSVASRANLLHGELKSHIYLGDRDGGSCAPWLVDAVEQGFSKAGLSVMRNHPYKGGYITDHYGGMAEVEALQVEMCERVYMDESLPAAAPGDPRFGRAQALIRGVLETVCREALQRLQH